MVFVFTNMRNRVFMLLVLVFSLLQGPLLPPVFVEGLLLVVVLHVNQNHKDTLIPRWSLGAFFVAGIIFDLVQGKVLGVTAMIFGVFMLLLLLLSRATSFKRTLLLATVAFFIDIVRAKIVFGQYFWGSAVVCFVVVYFVLKFTRKGREGGQRLEVGG